jgi:hypothetical protein
MDTVDIGQIVDNAAKHYGVDPNLANAVVTMESHGNPNAHSPAGAIGVMQLMPATAAWLGVKDPWDPVQNINGGMKYLAQLSARYNGDKKSIFAAYNAGPGAVDKHGGVPPYPETQNYVRTGMGMLGSRLLHQPPPSAPQAPTTQAAAPPAADIPEPWERQYASAPAAAAAGPATPSADIPEPWERNYAAPPPEPSPLEKAGQAFYQGIGGPKLLDIAKGVLGEITGDQAAIEGGKQALGTLVQGAAQGLVNEPARVGGELQQFGESLGQGNLQEAAHHVVGAAPLIGPGLQQVGQDIQRGDPAAAFGHAGAVVAPFLAGPALKAAGTVAGTAAETTARAAEATSAGIRAAAPDVVKGVAKAAAGTAVSAALPLPSIGKWIVGGTLTRPGLAQIMQGLKTGVAAARAAVPERLAAEAAAKASADAAARAAADEAMRQHVGTFEAFERMTQPPPLALPPPESIPMPPAGTYAEEQRFQALGPEPSTPAPAEATPAPAQPAPAAPAVTLGQAYAEAQGYDWAKLRPGDKALMENIARAHANVAAQPEPVTSPAPAAAPPAAPVAEQPSAAPLAPQQIAQNLKAEMERSGTAAPPEAAPPAEAQPTFAEAARARKTDALFDFITQKKIPMSWVDEFGDPEWKMVSGAAGVKPPSETSIAQLKQRLADYEKAQSIPVNPAITPAEARAAFEQARATRTQPAK